MSVSVIRVAQLVTSLAAGGAQATVLDSADMSQPLAPHGTLGPAEIVPAGIGQALIEVTVLAGIDGRDRHTTLWADPRLQPESTVAVPRLVRRLSPLNDVLTIVWLVRWLRRERPDVLHTHSSKAGVLGRFAAFLCRVPCAHTVHGWGPLYSERRFAAAVAVGVERMMARLCSAIVVVGSSDLHQGLGRGIGKPGQYRIIRSGVDNSIGAKAAAERAAVRAELLALAVGQRHLGAPRMLGDDCMGSDDYVVGMVARMAHPKDHLTLIEAFRRADIPGSRLVLIGDGPTRPAIEQAIAEAGFGSRVHLLGPRTDAARLVAGFDVSVLSSRWEGMPRSVVEAAAASVPIVASDVGNVRDLVEEGRSGRLVRPGNVEELAAALLETHRQRSLHEQMAATASVEAVRFSAQQMRRDLAQLWFDLASFPPSVAAKSHRDPAVAAAPEPSGSDRVIDRMSSSPGSQRRRRQRARR